MHMNLSSRRDFSSLMMKILKPLLRLYSPGCARMLPAGAGASYGEGAKGLEGFSRPLWALAPFWMGGGKEEPFLSIYQKGLAEGSNPESPEYWGDPGDYDQCFVEMAAIACAILEVPHLVWEPLAPEAKENLARWLYTINEHDLPECNWLFFRVLVNLALHKTGMKADMERMERDLDQIDSWYVEDGWYTDGPPENKPQRDYYVPWALEYYGVLYSVFAADLDPERCERFRQRALAFGKDFVYWFDWNGAALPYGRSLTYRFAQASFWSACVFAGLEPLPLPVMKGLIVRNLSWWLDKPIFDNSGVLTVGYGYPNLYMSERYNAPGSPYWGMKIFLVLALPKEHPFWKASVDPMPNLTGLFPQKGTGMLISRCSDGQVNAYAPGVVEKGGHGQFAEKYGKFCYNTRFGFSVSRSTVSIEEAAPDSMLAFVIEGEEPGVYVRRRSEEYKLFHDRIISTWSPYPGIRVETELIPCDQGHRRRHVVESSISCKAYDCGFAVPRFDPGFGTEIFEGGAARARTDTLVCEVEAFRGGKGVILDAWPNTNLYCPNTVIPAVCYEISPGKTELETRIRAWSLRR